MIRRMICRMVQWSAVCSLALSMGCATAHPGQPPFGIWEGSGHFTRLVNQKDAATGDPIAGQWAMIQRDYRTVLNIRPAELDGHEVIILDIYSYSGVLEDDNEKKDVHLRVALEKVPDSACANSAPADDHYAPHQATADTLSTYQLVAKEMNSDPEVALKYDPADNGPAPVFCLTRNGMTTLQICYDNRYWDFFRFVGSDVEKSGQMYDDNQAIQWVEKLHRK
ncbi:MAG: hypothetical protein HJJLKODD_01260 [Phycisphaerae bacterium]|nr:hypothetical protein [Phycisphaerae bacterium]